MNRNRASNKECRDHERLWRDYCVDRNLKDDWLERLNSLETLRLVSICEGHHDQRAGLSGRYPTINLKMKEWLLPGIARHWEELRVAVLSEMNQLFHAGDTDINVELKFKLRAGRGRLFYQEIMALRMRSFKRRETMEMDAGTYNWFERSVERVEGLDRMVLEWHHGNPDVRPIARADA